MTDPTSRRQIVAVTGANGFVGGMLMRSLPRKKYQIVGFDRYDGPLFRWLTRRYLQPLPVAELESLKAKVARRLWRGQKKIAGLLLAARIIRARDVNILDAQSRWIERFRGVDAVIHLAAIPHPDVPGIRPLDFEIINYWGSVNIFEAAVAAGVKRFIFASSGQVYDINHYKGWSRFPIVEEMADEIQERETTHSYSRFKWKFEKYLEERCPAEGVTGIALRLELPGVFGGGKWNLWVQTSVENLVQAFDKALQAALPAGGYRFNICNAEVPVQLGKLDELVAQHWPEANNACTGNQALLDLSAARKQLQFAPIEGGSYYLRDTVFE